MMAGHPPRGGVQTAARFCLGWPGNAVMQIT
jgi:hypothetical protein